MDKNTQQPVAWRVFRSATEYELFVSEYNARQRAKQLGSTAVQPLYTAPPVPREVLMAFGEELSNAVKEAAKIRVGNFYPYVGFSRVNITALADRYASQVQPEPVNQQLLAALKSLYRGYVSTLETGRDRIVALGGQCDAVDVMERNDPALRDARSAIAAAEAAQTVEEAVSDEVEREWENTWRDIVAPTGVVDITQLKKELADYSTLLEFVPKVYMHVTGGKISKPHTLPDIVCSVADDHMADCLADDPQPASAQQVTVPDGYVLVPLEPTSKILGEICHAKNQTASGYKATMTDTELASIYRAMLSAAQKPEGGE